MRTNHVSATLALSATLLFAIGHRAVAQESGAKTSQTSLKVEDVDQKKNTVDGDIDQEIVNAKLRAESGSKSRASLSFNGKYVGGSVENGFGPKRPNLSADPSAQTFTTFELGMSGRYRWTKNDSVTLGTAFGLVTPFAGRTTESDRFNVNDPSVAYARVGKVFDLQSTGSIMYGYGTSIPSRALDLTHQISASYNLVKKLGNFSVGASVATGYNFYDNKPGDIQAQRMSGYGFDKRTEYTLALYPQAEYAFSDKLSARTVFGYFNWRHLYGDQNRFRMLQTFVYQSIGLGWSVTRDVYLYPNLQFVPGNIRADFTNVNLNAIVNVF